MVFADGSSYEGNWDAGRIMGQGTRRYVTGVVYTGAFDDSQPHGRGVMERPGGLRYDGEWAHGMREGQGTITYPDLAITLKLRELQWLPAETCR